MNEMDYLRRACKISRIERVRNEEIKRERIHKRKENRIQRVIVVSCEKNEPRWPKRSLQYEPRNRQKRGRPVRKWINGIREAMIER